MRLGLASCAKKVAPLVPPNCALIRITNHNYSSLFAPQPILSTIVSRFQIPDPSSAFRQAACAGWNGSFSFMSPKGQFATGIIPDVKGAVEDEGLQCLIEDHRDDLADPPTIDAGVLDNITLRPYQVSIANSALQAQRGIVKVATGGGKTAVFAAILKTIALPSVVLFKSKFLVDQTYESFLKSGLKGVGRCHSEFFEPGEMITCSTLQSIHRLGDLVPRARAVVVDEVHQFSSPRSIRLLRTLKNAGIRLGFSATPFKEDNDVHNMRLKGFFGHLLADLGTSYLMDQSVLAKSVARFIPIAGPRGVMGLDYKQAEEKAVIDNPEFHQTVADIVAGIDHGRVLILVHYLHHGEALASLIPDSEWIQGQDDADTRRRVMASMMSDSPKDKAVVICSSIGFQGVDVHCHHLINAAGFKAPWLTLQKVGRGLRPAHDKHVLQYYDFMHLCNPYLMAHSESRMNTLAQEGHEVVVVNV